MVTSITKFHEYFIFLLFKIWYFTYLMYEYQVHTTVENIQMRILIDEVYFKMLNISMIVPIAQCQDFPTILYLNNMASIYQFILIFISLYHHHVSKHYPPGGSVKNSLIFQYFTHFYTFKSIRMKQIQLHTVN